MLASSPELWYLSLSGFTEPSRAAADKLDLPSALPLPALSTLVLQTIPERFMVQLLTHIQAPVCSCIVAADIPFYAVTNPNFQNLITPALRISDGIRITSSGATLFIISQQRPQIILDWIDSVEETVGIQITIRRGASGAASKGDIQSVLKTVMVHAPSKLTVAFVPSSSALPIMTAPELLRLLPSTKEIGCYRLFACHDVLQYLVTDDGEGSGFPCPDLETLTLSPRDDTEVELLRNLLRLRQNLSQSSGQRAGWSVRPLKSLFAPQSVLDMLNLDGLLEELETHSL
ncbi:hypothetical protein FRC04_005202 [Tulasnella sp. 424]|nr:hypothetical protein FRC04_005202 [Tulasnella sp. 424]